MCLIEVFTPERWEYYVILLICVQQFFFFLGRASVHQEKRIEIDDDSIPTERAPTAITLEEYVACILHK